MFSQSDLCLLETQPFRRAYDIRILNRHDITIHSRITHHDWSIISSYGSETCYILHRHSSRDPFHKQRGVYRSLHEALSYIMKHDKWFRSSH